MLTPDEYEQRTVDAIDYLNCPSCGEKAVSMSIGYQSGSFYALPHWQCETEHCEYSVAGDASWTVVLKT